MVKRLILMVLLVGFAWPGWAGAKVYRLTPKGDWFGVLNGDHLKPGDEVVLGPGAYRDRRRLVIGHRGTKQQPIVIRAEQPGKAAIHRPDDKQNTINIEGAQYLVIDGLEITGGSTGIRLKKTGRHPCKFVTIQNMHIHHVGGAAVTANNKGNEYEGLIFRRNHIHHTSGHGEGFYLGTNNAEDGTTLGCIFNSLIEGNYIHHLNGPAVNQGDGIEIKDGSYNNIIRDNVIHDTNYPGITVYGTDGKAPNIIERNAIWNTRDHGIQAAAEVIVRNNVIFDTGGDGIRSKNHQSARVGNVQIINNTIVTSKPDRAGIRISDDPTEPVTIANNAIYAPRNGFAIRLPGGSKPFGHSRLIIFGNVSSGALEGLPRRFSKATWNPSWQCKRDLDVHYFPCRGSLLIGAANSKYIPEDDFNGTPRESTHDVGAYRYNPAGNPGWTITPGFKKMRGDSSGIAPRNIQP